MRRSKSFRRWKERVVSNREPEKAPEDADAEEPDSLAFYKEPDFDSIYRLDSPDDEEGT